MPPLHRSRSVCSLPFSFAQRLEPGKPAQSGSMHTLERLPFHASIRRLSSRRARPTVTSLAEVFVNSLVMASFCPEHSPRERRMSSFAMGPVSDDTAIWRRRRVAGNRRVHLDQHLTHARSPSGYAGAQPSRVRKMFLSGQSQAIKERDREHDIYGFVERVSYEPRGQIFDEDIDTSPWPAVHRPNRETISETLHRTNYDILDASETEKEAPIDVLSPDPLKDAGLKKEQHKRSYAGKVRPEKERLRDASELLGYTLGPMSIPWKSAVKSLKDDPESSPRPKVRFRSANPSVRDAVELPTVQTLLDVLWDEKVSNQYIFRLYRQLPPPGVTKLSKRSLGALLRRFANPPQHRRVDARRLHALLEDMVTTGLPVSRSLWTSAIYMSGRVGGKVTKTDLRTAIGIWNQMERLAGVESDDVVFNILFNIAVKAGQYTVADRILEEMRDRGLEFSRAGKVSLIFYYGVLGDLDGISRAFDEFIESGEIVTTPVMNCLITSFLKAGDTQSAEELYARMMDTHKTVQSPPGTGGHLGMHLPSLSSNMAVYRKRARKMHRSLKLLAGLQAEFPEKHRALQESLMTGPDTRTFHIFLSHHAHTSGNIYKFMAILEDMEKVFSAPPRALVYLFLFEGFVRHGNKRKKQWSADLLNDVWKSYLRALRDSKRRQLDPSRPGELIWENPLARYRAETGPDAFYIPLPSSAAQGDNNSDHTLGDTDPKKSANDEIPDNLVDADESFQLDEMFNLKTPSSLSLDCDSKEIELQENGVFLGRRMIVTILRAFGACSGPSEVMEAWLRIEKIWQPEWRRANDVLVVREELERQMSRASRK
ncbi:hypothetical protein ASPZODRAFT_134801 [Penicilliopsis zonata CBS 506.65]|uniref:Pentacotripeptide-repeat region of PRORP domain-containing protein n=1 Tax=Penicilliopsis zonata CBS 506.65 TaxID=1073090 RepID=A0A1L9SC13_9EURO|nr:hypothetical protein ASPZODRAFT_134801 [Penicilliopsis zonata CBS 506.65]OJJ44706.1 hypothetical protein ASPZODRAFT_134801 [Penicilliopsis zonata CBS 506.65]